MIYVIGENSCGVVKIGWAKEPERRRATLQTGHPGPLRVQGTFAAQRRVEGALHRAFSAQRVRGEWFDFRRDDAVAAVARELGFAEVRPLSSQANRVSDRTRRQEAQDLGVLNRLRQAANAAGRIRATHTDIAAACDLSRSAAYAAVRRLISAGLLEVTRVGTGQFASTYQINDQQAALELAWATTPEALRPIRSTEIDLPGNPRGTPYLNASKYGW